MTLEKEQRGWTVSDGWSAVVRGRTAVAETCERILSIYQIIKEMCILHLSLVASEWTSEGGLRRRFIVEKSCLELPGVLLMTVE